jgi:hypothetical protein
MLQLELDLTAEQTELENIFRACSKNSEQVFQVDFINPGATVVRHRKSPQAWNKVAEGSWTEDDIRALVYHGLVCKVGESSMGWEISPRPELVGAL